MLVKTGERWTLIVSAGGPVEYFIGDFDATAGKFVPTAKGLVDRWQQLLRAQLFQRRSGTLDHVWMDSRLSRRQRLERLPQSAARSLVRDGALIQEPRRNSARCA